MTPPTRERRRKAAPPSGTRTLEASLRVLHGLIPAAQEVPGLLNPYLELLRTLRERAHPVGVRRLREVGTESGLRFVVDLGDRLGADLLYGFNPEGYESDLLLSWLRPGMTVVDVGANFGLHALSAAKRVGPGGSVLAFEPDPRPFTLLRRNRARNRLANVACRRLCLGGRDGETKLHLMRESAFSTLWPTGRSEPRSTVTLPERRLDSLVEREVHLIKIDVEGHEPAVLAGARATILRSPNLLIMVEVAEKNLDHERRERLAAEFRALYETGFTGWLADVGPDGLLAMEDPDLAAKLRASNLLLVRARTSAEERLRRAAREVRTAAARAADAGSGFSRSLRLSPADPRHGVRVHSAILIAALREQTEQLRAAEAECRTRGEELDRLDRKLSQVERDSLARLHEILERDESIRKLRQSVGELNQKLQAVDQESRARLEAVRAREASLSELGAERAGLQQRLEELERQHEASLEELGRRHQERLGELERRHEARLEELERRHQEQLAEREARIAELARERDGLAEVARRLDLVEQDSQARLQAIRERDARLLKMKDEVARLTALLAPAQE